MFNHPGPRLIGKYFDVCVRALFESRDGFVCLYFPRDHDRPEKHHPDGGHHFKGCFREVVYEAYEEVRQPEPRHLRIAIAESLHNISVPRDNDYTEDHKADPADI